MSSTIATAYVQIVPSADGIKGKLSEAFGSESEGVGESVGKNIGNSIGQFVKTAIIALGIGDLIKDAIMQGADLEQSIGGVETLFKDSSDTLISYANDAWKTAGLSANAYMETATSFAASLLQGLAGDTQAAAEVTDMAIIDMSDNANKMGTDMELIQNAYQGFAKQNYTMLDNLKLGYGGTKTEMERLLADAQELTGVEYNIDNLADVYSAIHTIQEEIGITGTTAKEGTETISGSLAAMKAAWSNLLADMTLGNDITQDVENLKDSVLAMMDNMLPAIKNLVSAAPSAILDLLKELGPEVLQAGIDLITELAAGFGESFPMLMNTALEIILTLVNTFIDNIPVIIDAGLQLVIGLVTGILEAVPNLLAQVPFIIESLVVTLLDMIPTIIDAGIGLFTALVEDLPTIITNIIDVIPTILDAVTDIFSNSNIIIMQAGVELLSALVENLPEIIEAICSAIPTIITYLIETLFSFDPVMMQAGFDLFISLIELLPQVIIAIVESADVIIQTLIDTFSGSEYQFENVGKNMTEGLWQGIKNGWGGLVASVKALVPTLVQGVKDSLEIKSPSRVFKREVGKQIPAGVAEGVEDNLGVVEDAMDELSNTTLANVNSEVMLQSQVTGTYDFDYGREEKILSMQMEMMERMMNDMRYQRDAMSDIVVPIYIGTELIDERIIRANQIQALRTGGK